MLTAPSPPLPWRCWRPLKTLPGRALRLAAWGLLGALPALAATPGPRPATGQADWRDQIIYFVLTDRFDDGDPSNNDQGAGEFNPASNAHYSGGDFKGLQRRLGYIQGLGATALWITPPVANQWWDGQYSGYHGYWAEHFTEVDKHLGTLADYQALAGDLHGRGMRLVQDIVVNHTGNYFSLRPGTPAGRPQAGYLPNTGSRPQAAPRQPPFDQNDARQPAHRAAAIYHWTPDVSDFGQRQQVLTGQMSGLDDLNTENPVVRRALRQSYGHWLREVGVDAFRVDTAFYVPPDYFTDLLHARDPSAPGLQRLAAQLGRPPVFAFGEGFAIDKPWADRGARQIEAYVRGPAGQPRLDGMLNFPLYGSLGDVLARGAPTAVLGHRIRSMMRVHSAPQLMPSFVDNHDVDRFLAGGSAAGLAQALLAIMTLPGIPVIYYGTEQGLTEQRGAMFAAGFGAGGRDHFDTSAPGYRLLQRLTALRRAHRVFSRGSPTVLQQQAHGPGVIAWRMQQGRDAALVVLNTADQPALLHALPTGLPAGTALPGLLALDGEPAALRTGPGGRVTAVLAPRSGQVWRLPSPAAAAAVASSTSDQAGPAGSAPRLLAARPDASGQQLLASGRARPGARLQLLLDADLGRATPVQAGADGRWSAPVPVAHLAESAAPHQLLAWSEADGQASAARPFVLRRAWRAVADVIDPAGDDQGPDGHYRYPTDPTWGPHRQMDLRRARAWVAGGALRLDITLQGLTQSWQPPNGFDHVALTLHFCQPGRDGASVMPLQQASLPDGLRWQHRLRLGGWSNALFSADGASATREGRPMTQGAALQVDRQRRRLRITLPAGALGDAAALRGLRIHISTWDYDGGYRALGPQPGPHSLGGGPPDGPKLMDTLLLALPG